MTKSDEDIPRRKKWKRDDKPRQKDNTLRNVDSQPSLRCRIKGLVGYENDKMYATITTTKDELDYQFWYPGRNKVTKEYKLNMDNYSWADESDGELIEETPKCNHSVT